MSQSFENYAEAYNAAVELGRQCKMDTSVRKCREFGRTVYNVNLLPKPEFRFGRDTEGEVVPLGAPLMAVDASHPGNAN